MTEKTGQHRSLGRASDQMRRVSITRGYTKHAEGSVLVEFGDTRVICNASVAKQVPPFLRGSGTGWVTAEYGMLPRSTGSRMNREAVQGKQQGRTQEIQRLIGRSLRASVDLAALGEHSIQVDCDVIQADGGTRTASVTGGCVALYDALQTLTGASPFRQLVAAVSVGIVKGQPVLDLDYAEDSKAGTDLNLVMLADGGLIELQGTAETQPFSRDELNQMLALGEKGIRELFAQQRRALELQP